MTTSTTSLPVARQLRLTRLDLAIVAFSVPIVLMAIGLATAHDRPVAVAWLPIVAATVLLRRRPVAAGTLMLVGSMLLRVTYIGIGYSNQIDITHAAAARVVSGLSPYGIVYPVGPEPYDPFVYGPLALLWWQPGIVVEFVAAGAVMALLVAHGAWLTLALYGGLPFAVFLTPTGISDYSMGLLIAVALLLAQSRPLVGAGLLATAAAIKPYAFAWFIPLIGFAGVSAAVVLLAISAVLWSPLLLWGPVGFLRSVQLHSEVHTIQANALNLPLLRWAAVPLAALGLFTRRWEVMVLLGTAVFVTYLFLDRWASLGYWLAVLPIAGMALEGRFKS